MIEGDWEEFERCFEPMHLARIHGAMERALGRWFIRYTEEAVVGPARFRRRRPVPAPRKTPGQRAEALAQRTTEAIADYHAVRERRYDPLLDTESLREFARDPRAFAMEALRDLPVIHKAVYSDLDEMTVWKHRFVGLLKRHPRQFLELVTGLVDFAEDYAEKWGDAEFASTGDPDGLGLEALEPEIQELREEYSTPEWGDGGSTGLATGRLCIPGIVGIGITSTLLHYRQPACFAPRGRHALAALWFLCDGETAGLETSEFLLWMIRNGSGSLGHNYAYPYRLFTRHLLYIADLLEKHCESIGVPFDRKHRMVLVSDFLFFVAEANAREIASWRDNGDV